MRDIHHPRLLKGSVIEGDIITLDGKMVEVLSSFNVYEKAHYVDVGLSQANVEEHMLSSDDLLTDLVEGRYITDASDQPTEASVAAYTTFPFYPAAKDVEWIVKRFKEHLWRFTTAKVYLLALYRKTTVADREVAQYLNPDDFMGVEEILSVLRVHHTDYVTNHLLYQQSQREEHLHASPVNPVSP